MIIPIIPVEDLMAEKLGIIVLCQHCYGKISYKPHRITGEELWIHNLSGKVRCNIFNHHVAWPRKVNENI